MEFVSPHERISPDFRYREILKSDTAQALGIPNAIERGGDVHRAVMLLFARTVQPFRSCLDKPLIVTSGYRCEELNSAVGGAPDSQHVKGEAVDLICPGMSPYALACRMREHAPVFDQLILEYDQGIVHISHSERVNRGEVLTRYENTSGNIVYTRGLVRHGNL